MQIYKRLHVSIGSNCPLVTIMADGETYGKDCHGFMIGVKKFNGFIGIVRIAVRTNI